MIWKKEIRSSVVVHTRSRNAHTHAKKHVTKMKNKIIIPSSWLLASLFLALFCFSPVLGDEYDHKVK